MIISLLLTVWTFHLIRLSDGPQDVECLLLVDWAAILLQSISVMQALAYLTQKRTQTT